MHLCLFTCSDSAMVNPMYMDPDEVKKAEDGTVLLQDTSNHIFIFTDIHVQFCFSNVIQAELFK